MKTLDKFERLIWEALDPTISEEESKRLMDDAIATLKITEVAACTTCGLVGHLAEDCAKS